MKKYLIVIEDTDTGYSAFSPDIAGCVATGTSMEEVEVNMREAIAFHLEGMGEDGELPPEPHSHPVYCEVPA
jgi:predicted RNase H-like HicB family nuclease